MEEEFGWDQIQRKGALWPSRGESSFHMWGKQRLMKVFGKVHWGILFLRTYIFSAWEDKDGSKGLGAAT